MDVSARPTRKLAAYRGPAIDRRGNFLETDAEHVVQQEGGPFERRETFERHHQRQRHVVDFAIRGLDDRLGQPRSDIGLAPMPRRFEMIEA